MIEKSKLSSRFKKKSPEKTEPLKFTLKKENIVEEKPQQYDFKAELTEKINSVPVWFDYSEKEQKELIKSFLQKKEIEENIDEVAENLYKEIGGFGPLNYLISQDNVSSVFVNGTNSVYIEIAGKILNTEIKLSEKELQFLLKNLLYKAGVKPDKSVLNFKFEDFSIGVIMPEISTNGVNISIRKNISYDLDGLIKGGMLTEEIFEFLQAAVLMKKNIVISGDINSGKTALLEVLINSALKDKRSVLIEENRQINFKSDTLIKLLINKNSKDFNHLLLNVLKLTPEYIVTDFNEPIVEFADCRGFISTLRASTLESAIMKLTTAFSAEDNLPEKSARTNVLRNYDFIIQINKCDDGIRRVTSVSELTNARTAALSVKTRVKFVDGQYITDIIQPLTSMRSYV